MSDKGNPISMRISDPVLDSLKKEARKISFEKDEDTSYLDLIRDAIEGYIHGVTKSAVEPIKMEVEKDYSDKDEDDFFDDLEPKEILKLCGIDLDNPLAKKMSKVFCDEVSKSVGRKLLNTEKVKNYESIQYQRDPASVAHVIARRGAVPDKVFEGETTSVPTFEIAAHPTVRLLDILCGRNKYLLGSAKRGAEAVRKEEESNVLKLFIAAAEERKDQIVTFEDKLTMGHVEQAYTHVARHSLIPMHLVCHPVMFINLQNAAAGVQGDWEFKIDPKNPTGGGHYRNAAVHVCDRCEVDTIIISAEGKEVGEFGIVCDPTVIVYPDVPKLRVGYVAFEAISLALLNDWAVSAIRQKAKKE